MIAGLKFQNSADAGFKFYQNVGFLMGKCMCGFEFSKCLRVRG